MAPTKLGPIINLILSQNIKRLYIPLIKQYLHNIFLLLSKIMEILPDTNSNYGSNNLGPDTNFNYWSSNLGSDTNSNYGPSNIGPDTNSNYGSSNLGPKTNPLDSNIKLSHTGNTGDTGDTGSNSVTSSCGRDEIATDNTRKNYTEQSLSIQDSLLNDSRITPTGNGNPMGNPYCTQPTSGQKWWAAVLLGFLFALISSPPAYNITSQVTSSTIGISLIDGSVPNNLTDSQTFNLPMTSQEDTGCKPNFVGLLIHTLIFIVIVRIILW